MFGIKADEEMGGEKKHGGGGDGRIKVPHFLKKAGCSEYASYRSIGLIFENA